MIEKKKIKIFEDDLKVISNDSFRKVREGKSLHHLVKFLRNLGKSTLLVKNNAPLG